MSIHADIKALQQEAFKFVEMSGNPYHELSLKDLAAHREKLKEAIEATESMLALVNAAIETRVKDAIAAERQSHDKPEGIIHAVVEGCDVRHTVAKRVVWDQDKLKDACNQIANLGYDPLEFGVKYIVSVGEREYNTLPVTIQQIVRDARTLKHGPVKIEVTPAK